MRAGAGGGADVYGVGAEVVFDFVVVGGEVGVGGVSRWRWGVEFVHGKVWEGGFAVAGCDCYFGC